jgi:hypothetical protein
MPATRLLFPQRGDFLKVSYARLQTRDAGIGSERGRSLIDLVLTFLTDRVPISSRAY